jgi:hypothetical protein
MVGMTAGPLDYMQLFVNKPPSYNASNVIWYEGGLSYNRTWATFSRGKWQNRDSADEIDQNVKFFVTAHPALMFEVQPAVIPCTGIACNFANLTFTAYPQSYGLARIDVVLQDDGGTRFGGEDTSRLSSFYIHIVDVLDPPMFSMPSVLNLVEDAGLYQLGNIITQIKPGQGASPSKALLSRLSLLNLICLPLCIRPTSHQKGC